MRSFLSSQVHCMLDLVDIGALSHSGQRVYNWTKLDASFDVLVGAGLTPFINLDGNPTGALHSLFQSHDFLFPARPALLRSWVVFQAPSQTRIRHFAC